MFPINIHFDFADVEELIWCWAIDGADGECLPDVPRCRPGPTPLTDVFDDANGLLLDTGMVVGPGAILPDRKIAPSGEQRHIG